MASGDRPRIGSNHLGQLLKVTRDALGYSTAVFEYGDDRRTCEVARLADRPRRALFTWRRPRTT